MKVLAVAAGTAVAAKDQMHSLVTYAQLRQRLSCIAQVPRSAHLRTMLRSQRFAATNFFLSMHCVQSVRDAAATRNALPSFTAGDGGGLSSYCASSPRWPISDQ